jgi:hypothetical protein
LASLAGAVLLLASCSFGVTSAPDQIADFGARLRGEVGNVEPGSVSYHFEYGPTDAYGSSTPVGQVWIDDPEVVRPVERFVSDLAEGTEYHYRLCTEDVDGHGTCGADTTFTTTSGHDEVHGFGLVFSLPELGFAIGGSVQASSDADGANAFGQVVAVPGSRYFRLEDAGPVTCLRVEGNRAAIGFISEPFDVGNPDDLPVPMMVFVEDNGPTGDRWGRTTLPAPADTCPVPTDADFPSFVVGPATIPPVLTSGDFVVDDAP